MNLETASRENVEHIVNWLKKRLTMVNTGIITAEDFDLNQYEDLLELYEVLQSKQNLSISELDAILGELGKLRKKA